MTTSFDRSTAERVARRAAAFIEDGVLRADLLEQTFDLFDADPAVRRQVELGLAEAGIRVVSREPAPAPEPPPVEVRAPRTNTTRTPTGRRPSPKEAGLAVIESDRLSRHPWRRILTASEEHGLCILMRNPGTPVSEPLPKGIRSQLDPQGLHAAAFDAMFLHNRGLVWSIIPRYLGHGLEHEDLEQSGYEGLRRAIEKFDASRQLKFSTYATHWINQAMSRAVANEGRLVRLPVYMNERINKVMAIRSRLLASGGRAPLFDLCAESGLRPEKVVEALRLSSGAISLDAPVAEDVSILDFLELTDEGDVDPLTRLIQLDAHDELGHAMSELEDRERSVLRMRFGFESDEPQTLETIGQAFGLTRERIRQIETKAKKRLAEVITEKYPNLKPNV